MDTSKFTYVQNNHFIARKTTLLKICDYVNRSIEKDRKDERFLAQWYPQHAIGKTPVYDETYFNFYLNTVLLDRKRLKIKIIDGNIYSHAWFSPAREYKIEMLNKSTSYQEELSANINFLNNVDFRDDLIKGYQKSPITRISSTDLLEHSFVISIDDRRLDLFNKLFTAHSLSLP